jgi:Ulp1 family protease
VSRVDFVSRRIELYDSYVANMSTESVLELVGFVAVLIPRLMRIGARSNRAYDVTPFAIERLPASDIPQQPPGTGTCGVFTGRFVEYLSYGVPLTVLNGFSEETMRRRFAIECYSGSQFAGREH